MLEETGLPYDAHRVDINAGDQVSEAFLSLNPNNKIPAIIDPDGPGGTPLALFESGAILIYLAEKTGQFLPADPPARYEVLQWLMFQMGGIGPMFGQMGYFVRFKGAEIEDPRPRTRYVDESVRLMKVLDDRLEGRDWICGDYSIADIAIAPWLRTVLVGYDAGPIVGWEGFRNLPVYLDRFLARGAVQRGLVQPPRD
ncbi:glutathione S-transferase family protein [Rhodovulum euryhalinum]|nr:glutathione S-transferase N-terminal domain-containing protein [Rhodovulum euryhalinum]